MPEADQIDIDMALEMAQELEDDGWQTVANCIRACARAAQDQLRVRAYVEAIRDGAGDASGIWIKSMAEGALRGDPILVGSMGNLRQLGADQP